MFPTDARHPVRNIDVDTVDSVDDRIDFRPDTVKYSHDDTFQTAKDTAEDVYDALPCQAPVSCKDAGDELDEPRKYPDSRVDSGPDDFQGRRQCARQHAGQGYNGCIGYATQDADD